MHKLRACGFVIVRKTPDLEILLMKHPTRWDFPKGHVDPGESDLETAIRELREETGITARDIFVDDRFCYQTEYQVFPKEEAKGGGTKHVKPRKGKPKTLVLFLGWLKHNVEVKVTEHEGFEWKSWSPDLRVQAQAIDPVLDSLAQFAETNHFAPPQ